MPPEQNTVEPLNCAARAKYRECAHTWRHLTQQHEIMLEENILRSLRANDLGAFFKFVNKRSSNRPHISTVTTSDGITHTTDVGIANAFNEYFASVSVHSVTNTINPPLCDVCLSA